MFVARFGQKVLTNKVIDSELKAIVKNIASFHDWIILEMETDKDHIHIMLSAPPRYSPSEVVKLIKTWTQRQLFKKYPKEVKQYLWGGKFWCQGYYVSTANDNTTKDEIKKYIRNQRKVLKQQRLI